MTSPDLPQGGPHDDGYWYVGREFEVAANQDLDALGSVVDEGAGGSGTAYVKLQRSDDRRAVQGVSIGFVESEQAI